MEHCGYLHVHKKSIVVMILTHDEEKIIMFCEPKCIYLVCGCVFYAKLNAALHFYRRNLTLVGLFDLDFGPLLGPICLCKK